MSFRLIFSKGETGMTIQECLDTADQMKPNMMPKPLKLRFLNEIEGLIHTEVLMKHEHTAAEEVKPEYDTDTDPCTELRIPDPYSMLYVYWLMSKIDLQNLEMEKYNNNRALFENAYETMSDWITRTRMPISAVREFSL